jgi:hypothetical protein
MTEISALAIKSLLTAAAQRDPRIVGVVDYGSGSEGRADEWSDVDVALFLRDADFDDFERGWKGWAAQFGPLLLAYVGGVGHPWAAYDARPIPLRVDFAFHRESDMDVMLTWPNAPTSVAAMVWYDATGGRLTEYARCLVGQPLGPPDLEQAFESVCGDFWDYALRTFGRLKRGQLWAARHDYGCILLGNLHALLRLEAGEVARWRASSSAVSIEQVITRERLGQLNSCIPGEGAEGLRRAFLNAARLAYEVCMVTARANDWRWPQRLAERTLEVLGEELAQAPTAT